MNESQLIDLSIQWSIRVSCGLVYGRLLYRLWKRNGNAVEPGRLEYRMWVIALLLFGLHVFLAFHYVHHWRHENAWQQTAVETEDLVGIRRGDGIWANYLMLAIWCVDVLRLHRARFLNRPTSVGIDRFLALFIGFMFFNATFVFGPIFYRYLFFPTFILTIWVWQSSVHRQSKVDESAQ
ncbi:hypothetical protein N9Z64_01760 [bacterium]|nr:hypothetical protein [Rhodopirellula sp.]MDB4353432.1 hypothetical protein [bacterium]MDB4393997.1 hypothetical protein [Rhodopirellula sp.]MDB4419461.1 hypothetical protein [bacterium]MDB4770869.1 hypothetical protein [bacterium]